jgi:dihydrodipicolinate synthase/N-acetylneuraminate lyase
VREEIGVAKTVDIRGAVPVVAMPFDDDGAIDEESLRREIDFCMEAGSQAICFGIASESNQLTDAECAQVWSMAARHLNGAAPLIVATAHVSREGTTARTRMARESGADCAMVNPSPRSGDALVALFRQLSERVGLPLMVQDVGPGASVEILLRTAQEAPQVVAAKIESAGGPLKIERLVSGLREAEFGNRVTVLGGAGGNWLPEELEAGSVGTMPHPAIIDAFRTVCDRYAAGDTAGGLEAYQRLITPHLRAINAAGPGQGDGGGTLVWVHKELLRRAGIFKSAYCRSGNTAAPESVMRRVLDHALQNRVLDHALQNDLLIGKRAG